MAIGVGVLLGLVFAVRHVADGLAHDPFRIFLQLLHGGLERRHAVFLRRALQFLLRSLERTDVGLGVALDVERRAGVIHDDGEQVLAHLAGLVEFQGRQAQTFTGDMGASKGLATGSAAAEIHPVPTTDTEGDDLCVEENRTQEGHVIDVRTALIGIVQHIDIARLHAGQRILLDDGLGAELHRGQMDRAVGGLREQLALVVINRIGEIDHVRQDRRERGALEDGRHALTRVLEDAAQDLEGDRIDLGLIDDGGIDFYFLVHRELLAS